MSVVQNLAKIMLLYLICAVHIKSYKCLISFALYMVFLYEFLYLKYMYLKEAPKYHYSQVLSSIVVLAIS